MTYTRVTDGVTQILAAHHNDLADGLEAAEAKLGYVLTAEGAAFSPLDSTNYLFGSFISRAPLATTTDRSLIYFPQTGTISRVDFYLYVGGILGTTEAASLYIRINGSDTLLSSSITADLRYQHFAMTGLSVPVTTGDYFEFKLTTPAYATNPTTVTVSAQVFVN